MGSVNTSAIVSTNAGMNVIEDDMIGCTGVNEKK